MPALPVIDPHVHLWDQRNTPRAASPLVKALGWNRRLLHWVAARVFPKSAYNFFGAPQHVLADYLADDYRADVAGRDLRGFVHIEAGWAGKGPMAPVDETRWLESLQVPLLKAIVGHVDLRADSAGDVLAAHMAASPRFRGVRHTLSNHPDKTVMNGCEQAALYSDDRWRKGFALLGAHDLSFEATVYDHQLPGIAELAAAFPETTIVLCHTGTPVAAGGGFGNVGRDAEARSAIVHRWRDGMSRLAEHPNVYVKLSGLAMPCLGFAYHRAAEPRADQVAEDFAPLIDHTIDVFGAERCMFGSNFPVDKVSMSWATLYDAFERVAAARTPADRRSMFHDTAARVYRLDVDGQSA